MCGIIGTLNWSRGHPSDPALLRKMLNIIQHRGPDEFGLYTDDQAAIGSARLMIIDLASGQQPIPNEDRTLWIVFNGEIYNYVELRIELEQAGHHFSTHTDTEVILHLYEDLGTDCLQRLNGQFAIAIWDARQRRMFLARDRLGIRPLFYAELPHGLVFGSEIKALLLHPQLDARLDPLALAQAFTFWSPLARRTVFKDIHELEPGHYLLARNGVCEVSRYWSLRFPAQGQETLFSRAEAAEQIRELLSDATRLRLRADVPVGSYLSGGLDSTCIAALARQHIPGSLCTFSIAFQEAAYDERRYQEIATAALGTAHVATECTSADIGRVFPQVVWHAEAPLLRTSPAPMYLLSKLVHDNDMRVVLTGEGADEFFGGYNIFKEDQVRRFWARYPESTIRPLLLQRLYPYIADLNQGGGAYLKAFFQRNLTSVEQLGYSHQLRWRNTLRLQRLFSADLQETCRGYDPIDEFLGSLDGMLSEWSPLAQAQYIEVTTFMSAYLLSSQGDRMMSAHSVEGRFPFLDHRLVEFSTQLAPQFKLRGLHEKVVLKQSCQDLVPDEIRTRAKQPYRAPIRSSFLKAGHEYVKDILGPEAIRDYGIFDPQSIGRLLDKCQIAARVGENDEMALVGALSTQLLYRQFVQGLPRLNIQEAQDVRLCTN